MPLIAPSATQAKMMRKFAEVMAPHTERDWRLVHFRHGEVIDTVPGA